MVEADDGDRHKEHTQELHEIIVKHEKFSTEHGSCCPYGSCDSSCLAITEKASKHCEELTRQVDDVGDKSPLKGSGTRFPSPKKEKLLSTENDYCSKHLKTSQQSKSAWQVLLRKSEQIEISWTAIVILTVVAGGLLIVWLHYCSHQPSPPTPRPEDVSSHLRTGFVSRLDHLRMPETSPALTNWQIVMEKASTRSNLHVQVVHADATGLTSTIEANTVRIQGRPSFCSGVLKGTESVGVPAHLRFESVTHLHLHDMGDCDNYVERILGGGWEFPKVKHLKLSRVQITESVFDELIVFIDRNAETLYKLEIDECYLCPSPHCDAGMITFPDHDFQLLITRRRENPSWKRHKARYMEQSFI